MAAPLLSEDAAWEFLEQAVAVAGQPEGIRDNSPTFTKDGLALAFLALYRGDNDEVIEIDWTKLELSLRGSKYHSTLTPALMTALLDFQSGINRSLSLVQYGVENARLLTDVEKSGVEILVEVREGSSLIQVDGTEVAKHFIDAVVNKMTGTEAAIVIIVFILAFFGYFGLKMFLVKRAEIQIKKIEADERNKDRDAAAAEARARYGELVAMSEQETRRTELLTRAFALVPQAEKIADQAERAHESIVRASAEADVALVQGAVITGEVAADLIAAKRASGQDVTIRSVFEVLEVATNAPEGFRVKLQDVETNEVVVAHLRDALLSEKEGKAIQQAEWSKLPLRANIEGRLLRGTIKDAVIVSAEVLDRPQADIVKLADRASGQD